MSLSETLASKPLHRFTLFGRPAAGKSCWAAALAMARRPHGEAPPSVTFIPKPPQSLLDRRNARVRAAPLTARQMEDARIWVEEASARILTGEPLPPTPTDALHPLIFASATDAYAFLFEIADYSGELWSQAGLKEDYAPNEAEMASAGQVAHKIIRERALQGDGIVILADRPRGGHGGLSALELKLLASAFHEMAAAKTGGDLPAICVAVNKWDRSYPEGEPKAWDPQEEDRRLEDFLKSDEGAFHRSLLTEIRRAVGESNVICLPVSALGPCKLIAERIDNKGEAAETPTFVAADGSKDTALRSLNAAEPFVWLAEKAAERWTLRAENAAREASLIRLGRSRAVLREATEQTAGHAVFAERVTAARKLHDARILKQGLTAAAVVALIGAASPPAARAALDAPELRAYEAECAANLQDETLCPQERLSAYGARFARLASGSPYLNAASHALFLGPDQAEARSQAVGRELADRALVAETRSLSLRLTDLTNRGSALMSLPLLEVDSATAAGTLEDLRQALAHRPDDALSIGARPAFEIERETLDRQRAAANKLTPELETRRKAALDAEVDRDFREAMRVSDVVRALDALFEAGSGRDPGRAGQVEEWVRNFSARQIEEAEGELQSRGRESVANETRDLFSAILGHPQIFRLSGDLREKLRRQGAQTQASLDGLTQNARYQELREAWEKWSPGVANVAQLESLLSRDNSAYPPAAHAALSQARDYFERNKLSAEFRIVFSSVRSLSADCENVVHRHKLSFAGMVVGDRRTSTPHLQDDHFSGSSITARLNARDAYRLEISSVRVQRLVIRECPKADSAIFSVSMEDLMSRQSYETHAGHFRYRISVSTVDPKPDLHALSAESAL